MSRNLSIHPLGQPDPNIRDEERRDATKSH